MPGVVGSDHVRYVRYVQNVHDVRRKRTRCVVRWLPDPLDYPWPGEKDHVEKATSVPRQAGSGSDPVGRFDSTLE